MTIRKFIDIALTNLAEKIAIIIWGTIAGFAVGFRNWLFDPVDKGIIIIVLFIISFVFGLIVIKCMRIKKDPKKPKHARKYTSDEIFGITVTWKWYYNEKIKDWNAVHINVICPICKSILPDGLFRLGKDSEESYAYINCDHSDHNEIIVYKVEPYNVIFSESLSDYRGEYINPTFALPSYFFSKEIERRVLSGEWKKGKKIR